MNALPVPITSVGAKQLIRHRQHNWQHIFEKPAKRWNNQSHQSQSLILFWIQYVSYKRMDLLCPLWSYVLDTTVGLNLGGNGLDRWHPPTELNRCLYKIYLAIEISTDSFLCPWLIVEICSSLLFRITSHVSHCLFRPHTHTHSIPTVAIAQTLRCNIQ